MMDALSPVRSEGADSESSVLLDEIANARKSMKERLACSHKKIAGIAQSGPKQQANRKSCVRPARITTVNPPDMVDDEDGESPAPMPIFSKHFRAQQSTAAAELPSVPLDPCEDGEQEQDDRSPKNLIITETPDQLRIAALQAKVNASLEAGSRRPKNSDYVMSTEEEAAFAEARSMWEGKRKMREQWEAINRLEEHLHDGIVTFKRCREMFERMESQVQEVMLAQGEAMAAMALWWYKVELSAPFWALQRHMAQDQAQAAAIRIQAYQRRAQAYRVAQIKRRRKEAVIVHLMQLSAMLGEHGMRLVVLRLRKNWRRARKRRRFLAEVSMMQLGRRLIIQSMFALIKVHRGLQCAAMRLLCSAILQRAQHRTWTAMRMAHAVQCARNEATRAAAAVQIQVLFRGHHVRVEAARLHKRRHTLRTGLDCLGDARTFFWVASVFRAMGANWRQEKAVQRAAQEQAQCEEAAALTIQLCARGHFARRIAAQLQEEARRPGHNAKRGGGRCSSEGLEGKIIWLPGIHADAGAIHGLTAHHSRRAAARAARRDKRAAGQGCKSPGSECKSPGSECKSPLREELPPLQLRAGENAASPTGKDPRAPGPLTMRVNLDISEAADTSQRRGQHAARGNSDLSSVEQNSKGPATGADTVAAPVKSKDKEKRKHKKKHKNAVDKATELGRSQTHMGFRESDMETTPRRSHSSMEHSSKWDTLNGISPRRSHSSMEHYSSEDKARKWGSSECYANGTREDILLANIVRRIDSNAAKSTKYGAPNLNLRGASNFL